MAEGEAWGSVSGHRVSLDAAVAFLAARYRGEAHDVSELGGGAWSRAISFRLGERHLVARFGPDGDDFAKDQRAMAIAGPHLPVPRVFEIGETLGGAYVISQRHFGLFLESLDEPRWRRVVPALLRALDAMRDFPIPGTGANASGMVGGAGALSWREWLVAALVDHPGSRMAGWRGRLAESRELEELFVAGEEAFAASMEACPELRHLLHIDLLNRNVLVSDDGSRLVAVFDWACSTYGDFLYEVACFTFWAPWQAGLAAVDFRAAIRAHYRTINLDVPCFDDRLRAYELHVGLAHLAFCVCVGAPPEHVQAVARRVQQILRDW